MKRMLLLALFVAAGLAFTMNQVAWSKGHVPSHKVQACHNGTTITVGAAALAGHQAHGDGQLPACDTNNIFHTGDSCPADADGDGFADLANPRGEASTPSCQGGVF